MIEYYSALCAKEIVLLANNMDGPLGHGSGTSLLQRTILHGPMDRKQPRDKLREAESEKAARRWARGWGKADIHDAKF